MLQDSEADKWMRRAVGRVDEKYIVADGRGARLRMLASALVDVASAHVLWGTSGHLGAEDVCVYIYRYTHLYTSIFMCTCRCSCVCSASTQIGRTACLVRQRDVSIYLSVSLSIYLSIYLFVLRGALCFGLCAGKGM